MASLRNGKVSAVSLVERLRNEVDQLCKRSINGLEYLRTPAPQVGTTPRTLLHRRGTLALYHYQATTEEVYRVPLLFVMPTTNKASIFDLAKGQSLIGFLLDHGYDVYVMDWNAPTTLERHLKLENYVLDFIPDCIRRVQEGSGIEDVTLVGYCMGGLLSTIYAALHPDGPVKNLVLFTTPTDWTRMIFRKVVEDEQFSPDRVINSQGLLPPTVFKRLVELHRPAGPIATQIRLWDNMWNEDYVRNFRMMLSWGDDTLPLAGDYYRQIVEELLRKNGLYEGTLCLDGKRVELKNIRIPLLHVIAEHDTLVTPECARPLVAGVSSQDKEELILPGGHVSLMAGPAAIRRLWPKLDQWLGRRSV
ncbi:alpha/beta fold hydrolase [Pseudomonas schmalbachii]|uniref:alpha/beta fold hydrolase n=1 Tax=Pseudomonas schmalbachii TaxID=2816993 RepID=UPI000FC0F2C6|nr:alpha/beta fold hydrolase [Pseudomonas schmalbachii]